MILEDGTGVKNANSYATQLMADNYFADRGNATWAALTDDQKEQALIRATDYLVEAYRGKWKGYRSNIYQGLDWPRKSVILTDMAINYMWPFNSIPPEIVKATAELALRASQGDLAADLNQQIISEGVSGIVTTYDKYSPQQTRYRAIEMMLIPYLATSSAMTTLGRA